MLFSEELLTNKKNLNMKKIEKTAIVFVVIAALGIVIFWIAGVLEYTLIMKCALLTSGASAIISIFLFSIHKLRTRNLCD